MNFTEQLKNRLEIRARLNQKAADFPGQRGFPYGIDPHVELERVCDWIVGEQGEDGLWHSPDGKYYFYADAYAVRALLAALILLGKESYGQAAQKWLDYIIGNQRPDGGWWTGYPAATEPEDKTTVYLADDGEIGMALIAAHAVAQKNGDKRRAEQIRKSLLKYYEFIGQFRLPSGGIGAGYSQANNLEGRRQVRARYGLYLFATVAAGVAFQAGLYSVIKEEEIWRNASLALGCCLEHTHPWPDTSLSLKHDMESRLDFRLLYRCMDTAFHCSPAPLEQMEPSAAPGLRFKSSERQKIYNVWKHCMELIAESQMETGEWSGPYDDKEYLEYDYNLRHRLYFLYALTTYLQKPGLHAENEGDLLTGARNRQLWLCSDPFLLKEHYGVCINKPMMPSGVWGMIMSEMAQGGITVPGGLA